MKPSLFGLLFLFAFITSSTAADLLDTDGDVVRNGGAYYIKPWIWALGGGVGLAKTGNQTCPLTVVTTPEIDNGLPWAIASPLRIAILSTNMAIDFYSVEGKVPSCVPKRSAWTIVEGENGVKSVEIRSIYQSTWRLAPFKFQRVNNLAYKIVYCATFEDGSCVDVGRSRDGLVLSPGNPLPVVITKAESFKSGIAQVVDN